MHWNVEYSKVQSIVLRDSTNPFYEFYFRRESISLNQSCVRVINLISLVLEIALFHGPLGGISDDFVLDMNAILHVRA
jgi:hypothetical protein